MAETRTISCDDCGHAVVTGRANAKYCSVCRLIRDLPFTMARTYQCKLCDANYAALHIRDPLCGDCSPVSPRHGDAECSFCHKERPRAVADITVCNVCIRDPKLRKQLWSSLKRKQAQRRETANV